MLAKGVDHLAAKIAQRQVANIPKIENRRSPGSILW